MPSVDNRVVNMEFNNSTFEQKIAGTLAALTKLEEGLKLKGAQDGLKNVSASADKLNFNGAQTGVQGLSAKFAALATIGITALANITTKAMQAGAQILKSLSIQPILDGFHEYELNMNSIQTILSNTKGDNTNITQVNAALDQLNTYADKTIYNFGQMTRNIGTFTAAGVKLDVAVSSIKGISNLAALSGSSADQASTAMYQLSQAISTGTLKLMDWNSVVNAGMGGKVFQNALFEAGKAMKTLKGVDMNTTFDQWTSSGHSFRESLQDGWITADVLTTTLGAMSGEMTDAQLKAKGFSDVQIKAFQEMGQTGLEAATKIRTFTQLVSTIKESIGSGWSETFRILVGNFEEATNLWSGIGDALGKVVQKNADMRNNLLTGFKSAGGMIVIIDGVRQAVHNLGAVIAPMREAFREVFPRMTSENLLNAAKAFHQLAEAIKPSERTVASLHLIFEGFFSALKIGWTIISQGIGFIAGLVRTIAGLAGIGSGGILSFFGKLGSSLSDLRFQLVDKGGIKKFFDGLSDSIQRMVPYLERAKAAISDFFSGIKAGATAGLEAGVDRVNQRFGTLRSIVSKVGDILSGALKINFQPFLNALETGFDAISGWFKDLGHRIAAALGPGDFNDLLDTLNTGLLGGIALMISKWMKGGLKLDVGDGLFGSIKSSFEALTGQLKAMQTQVKAETIQKIAVAVGILTASVVALSLIDSAALTKALTAMAVGFGQLLGVFKILDSMVGDPKSVAEFAVVAAGLNLLATAMVTLSVAVAILSRLSWNELAKGLGGILVLLGGLTIVSGPLGDSSGGMIRAGIGITALAIGLNILAVAVKIFSTMSWGDMVKGLVGVAGGLVIIAGAMQLMPTGMALQGVGLMAVAAGLNVLALAVKQFSGMSWEDLGKGAAAIAGGLLLIAGAMNLMPPNLPITAAGLIGVAIAMNILAVSLRTMGGMDWGEIGKGLTALAGSLIILAAALNLMSGTVAGATALGLAALSLGVLQKVLQSFADMGWGDILNGLGGLAVALGGLALMSVVLQPLVPAMLGLGIALGVLSAAFVLFSAGALMTAKAFEIFAKVGTQGAKSIKAVLQAIGEALPDLFIGLARGIIKFAEELAKGLPVIVKILGELLTALLDALIKLTPKLMVWLGQMLGGLIKLGYTYGPDLIKLGFTLFMNFLDGLRQNIGEITNSVAEIIINFLNALTPKMPEIVAAGMGLLAAFLQGIADNIWQVANAVTSIIVALIEAFGSHVVELMNAGTDVLLKIMFGIVANIIKVTEAATTIVTELIRQIGSMSVQIADAGATALVNFVAGLGRDIQKIVDAGGNFVVNLVIGIGNRAQDIINAGATAIGKFIDGLGQNIGLIIGKGADFIINLVNGISDNSVRIVNAGIDAVIKFINGVADGIRTHNDELRSAGINMANAIIDGMTGGLSSRASDVATSAWNVAKGAVGSMWDAIKPGSPSKITTYLGKSMSDGLAAGMDNGGSDVVTAAERVVSQAMRTFNDNIGSMSNELGSMNEFNPVITPVLDLTRVASDASKITDYIRATQTVVPTVSYDQAKSIAVAANRVEAPPEAAQRGSTAPMFQQVINAPKQLSTGDIYRQTRNQIALAKEELKIP